jgi:hypothetical protein
MSFHADFIDRAEKELAQAYPVWGQLTQHSRSEWDVFGQVTKHMRRAQIIRMGGDQAQVFMDTPAQEGQDYIQWLRLPFLRTYIQFDQPVVFSGYLGEYDHGPQCEADETGFRDHGAHQCKDAHTPPPVRGVLLLETTRKDTENISTLIRGPGGDVMGESRPLAPDAVRLFQVTFLMPRPDYFLNVHMVTATVTTDNRLDFDHRGFWQTRKRMLDWTVHVINFLTSPSVVLVPNHHDPALQRARARRGKPPLPDWFELTYRRHVRMPGSDKVAQGLWKHSYRYDVRGHPMLFRRGKLAGRVIWCPPHQRGLANTLYRPRGYRVEACDGDGAPQE